jgi:hypothetical protein
MEWPRIVKIKLVRRYSIHQAGRTVDCEDVIAQRLIAEGVAVSAEPQPVVETASIEPEAERADLTPRRGRRKRSAIPQSEETDAAGG